MSTVELQMPLIEDGARWAYGGDQEWCSTRWKRLSGCGPTTGANLAAYYAKTDPAMRELYTGNTDTFEKQQYVDAIEDMFRFITPSYMGFPYAGRYALKFRAFALYHNITLDSVGCGVSRGQQMFDFVRRGIDSGNPLALLILRHRAPEMREDNWHWVTVSGYTEGGNENQVILSNCGERQVRPASLLFDRNPGNTLRLLYFKGHAHE